jgi:hypothetical protein
MDQPLLRQGYGGQAAKEHKERKEGPQIDTNKSKNQPQMNADLRR